MFLQEIPEDVKTTTLVQIRYDCDGGFERCGKEWTLKHKDAQKNFEKNDGKHICRQCWLKFHNPAKKKEVRDKMKKTCLERYGTTCALNTEENTAARVEKMFGTEEAKQKIVAKRRKTSRKKYGTDHPMQNAEVKAHWEQVFIDKYGVRVPLQDPTILAKMQATNLERYGVTNVASLPEVRKKMAKTTLERHGVEHYNQLPEMREYLREHCAQWLKESWDSGGPMKGITRPEEWNEKQRQTVAIRIQSGNWNGGFKSNCRGRYNAQKCRKDNPRFLSSLELKMHYFLDNNQNVEWYDYECLAIPYTKTEGTKHLYFPDFLVKFIGDPLEHIIETKTWKEKDSINVQLKQEAALDYATDNNMTYTIMFDEDVEEFGLDLDVLKELPQVSLA